MSASEHPNDPAFPVLERGSNGLELTCHGLTKRELFAAIAMHGLIVEPVSGAQSMVEYLAPTEAGDAYAPGARIARAAAVMADAQLEVLAEPRPEPEPKFPEFNVYAASPEQREALKTLRTRTWFDVLPQVLRTYVESATSEIARRESGDDDIPF